MKGSRAVHSAEDVTRGPNVTRVAAASTGVDMGPLKLAVIHGCTTATTCSTSSSLRSMHHSVQGVIPARHILYVELFPSFHDCLHSVLQKGTKWNSSSPSNPAATGCQSPGSIGLPQAAHRIGSSSSLPSCRLCPATSCGINPLVDTLLGWSPSCAPVPLSQSIPGLLRSDPFQSRRLVHAGLFPLATRRLSRPRQRRLRSLLA